MKKLISLILSISICFGAFAAGALADADSIDDGLSDLSKTESVSEGVNTETKKLGSYNGDYAYSEELIYELVYRLKGVASFEVATLNMLGDSGVKFYAGADNKNYTELQFETETESLSKSWTLNKHTGAIEVENAEYFKIEITQTKSKYIRIDNVKLISNFELEPSSVTLLNGDEKMSGENVYGADKLKIQFNQPVSVIPELTVAASDGTSVTADGVKTDEDTVVYEFNTLGFDIYTFSADGFETLSKQSYNFEKTIGIKAVYGMPNVIHFGERYTKSGYITEFKDSLGNTVIADNLKISIDSDIISIEDDNFVLNKAGECVISVSFEINGIAVSIDRSITLCGVENMTVTPSSMTLKNGESSQFKVELQLSDGTVCEPETITAESADYTIAQTKGTTVKGVGDGSTFVNVTVNYYGQTYKAVIAVGVGNSPLPAAKDASLAFNRDSIAVGESIYPIVNCRLEDGAYADSLSMQKTYHSDNDSVVKADSDGKITAVSEGTANVWADITVGGAAVETNRVQITVTKDEIVKAELVLPAYYMRTGSSMEASVRVFTKTGASAKDYTVEYAADGTAVSVNANKLNAVLQGKSNITATVTDGSSTIVTDPISVEVGKDNGEDAFMFLNASTLDDVFEHSDDLIIDKNYDTGIMPNARNQYVIFKSDEEISGLNMKFHYLTARQEDEIQVWVSADNSEGSYTRITEDKMTVTERIESGAWYYLWFKYNGELLQNMRYVKITISVQEGENPQGKRLHEMHLEHDNIPEVIGVSLINKNGTPANGTDASSIAVTFSQNIDKTTLDNITFKQTSDGQEKEFEGVYNDGIYTMNVGKLDDAEYLLRVDGVKNAFGTEMNPYEFTIKPVNRKNIETKGIQLQNGEISAVITNNTSRTLSAKIITVTYDNNMRMQGMFADTAEIAPGENNYTASSGLQESALVKVYVWSDLKELNAYN